MASCAVLADRAGQLIESNLLLCLNDPPNKDFAWAKPEKTTFHRWNGTVEHGAASTPEANFATHKKYIDFSRGEQDRVPLRDHLFPEGDPGMRQSG